MGKSRENLKNVDFPLIGFAGRTTYPLGEITVVLCEGWKTLRTKITFIVIDAPNSFNVILGRTTLTPNKIVASTCHQKMKFLTPHGIDEVKGDQHILRRYYMNVMRRRNQEEFCIFRQMTYQ